MARTRLRMEWAESDSSSDSLIIRILECRFFRRARKKDEVTFSSGSFTSRRNLRGLGELEFLEELAEGGYGRVFRCRDLKEGGIVAVKQIAIIGIHEGIPGFILREVSLLKELNHPNIVRLLRVISMNDKYVNLVFEQLDCDLHQYIYNRRYPKDSMTRKSLLHQILSGVAYCHAHKILHRDLKPRNLLVDLSKMTVKLADFGLAREFADPDTLYTDKIATRWYRAPEILFDSRRYSTPVDLWSVGCIFGEMVLGKPVFQAISCPDELESIFRMLGAPSEDTWPGVTELCTHLQSYAEFKPMDLSTIFADLEPAGVSLLSVSFICFLIWFLLPGARGLGSFAPHHTVLAMSCYKDDALPGPSEKDFCRSCSKACLL
ncbi:Serine/threonine-protein kinase, active site [Sesbania bispinosa]|nr:Serine/threonine-protein kinase, active site [Sesbania bispinosa]